MVYSYGKQMDEINLNSPIKLDSTLYRVELYVKAYKDYRSHMNGEDYWDGCGIGLVYSPWVSSAIDAEKYIPIIIKNHKRYKIFHPRYRIIACKLKDCINDMDEFHFYLFCRSKSFDMCYHSLFN